MFEFKPEDFKGSYYHNQPRVLGAFARRANEILQKEIALWPVVYSMNHQLAWFKDDSDSRLSRRARLAFIEPIVKEECKHEPTNDLSGSLWIKQICKHCGVELVAEWKAK